MSLRRDKKNYFHGNFSWVWKYYFPCFVFILYSLSKCSRNVSVDIPKILNIKTCFNAKLQTRVKEKAKKRGAFVNIVNYQLESSTLKRDLSLVDMVDGIANASLTLVLFLSTATASLTLASVLNQNQRNHSPQNKKCTRVNVC